MVYIVHGNGLHRTRNGTLGFGIVYEEPFKFLLAERLRTFLIPDDGGTNDAGGGKLFRINGGGVQALLGHCSKFSHFFSDASP